MREMGVLSPSLFQLHSKKNDMGTTYTVHCPHWKDVGGLNDITIIDFDGYTPVIGDTIELNHGSYRIVRKGFYFEPCAEGQILTDVSLTVLPE